MVSNNYPIFVFIINRLMFRPLAGIMEERDEYMDRLKQDAVRAEAEMTRITKDLAVREAAARNEARSLKKDMEEAGNERAEEIYTKAKEDIARIKNETAIEVDSQIKQAREHLQVEAEALATGIMEKILNRKPVL